MTPTRIAVFKFALAIALLVVALSFGGWCNWLVGLAAWEFYGAGVYTVAANHDIKTRSKAVYFARGHAK